MSSKWEYLLWSPLKWAGSDNSTESAASEKPSHFGRRVNCCICRDLNRLLQSQMWLSCVSFRIILNEKPHNSIVHNYVTGEELATRMGDRDSDLSLQDPALFKRYSEQGCLSALILLDSVTNLVESWTHAGYRQRQLCWIIIQFEGAISISEHRQKK